MCLFACGGVSQHHDLWIFIQDIAMVWFSSISVAIGMTKSMV
jgi:hypothetical protein